MMSLPELLRVMLSSAYLMTILTEYPVNRRSVLLVKTFLSQVQVLTTDPLWNRGTMRDRTTTMTVIGALLIVVTTHR